MPYDTKPSTFISRHAAASVLTTIALAGVAIFIVQGAPGRAIQQWKDSSGTVVCEVGSGGTLSGDCLTGILSSGDANWVNVSGDTMTGALSVQAAMSGYSLAVSNLIDCDITVTDSSGNVSCGTLGTYVNTGALTTAFNGLYVEIAGDTMTGGLIAPSFSGGTILAASGAVNVQRKYATFVLYSSGTTTATGANVFGDWEIPLDGTFVASFANVGEAADDGVTEVDVEIGGTSIYTTTLTIDATETSSRTAAAAASIDTANDDFVAGNIITFATNTPSTTPATALNVTLVFDITSTP